MLGDPDVGTSIDASIGGGSNGTSSSSNGSNGSNSSSTGVEGPGGLLSSGGRLHH